MRKIELSLETLIDDKVKTIGFSSPVELLLSGFKLSYVSPDKIEEKIYEIASLDRRFTTNSKSNCLEESILNFPSNSLEASAKNYHLRFVRKL